jgi:hypothetical protein
MAFVELFALAGVALAQPIFDLVGKNANELIVNGRTRLQIITMVILVLLVPPFLAWVTEVAVGMAAPRLRRYAHAAVAAVLVAILAVEVLKRQTQWGSTPLIIAGVVVGIGGGVLLLRSNAIRLFLHYLAIAPIVFAILFLFFSPVSRILFPNNDAAADVEIGSPDPVVMVVMDELPLQSLLDGTGQIDAELFPNFARLARTSSWYRNYTTVSPHTKAAVPAILTGVVPADAQALPLASEYPRSLFTLLGGRYRVNAHEYLSLCPDSICPAPGGRGSDASSLRDLLIETARTWKRFASPKRQRSSDATSAFETRQISGAPGAFIRSLTDENERRFDFLHVMLPHQGWRFLPSGQDNLAYWEVGHVLNGQRKAVWPTEWSASVGRQRHLQQLQHTDNVLGRLIRRLERLDAYDESLIVVTADHGIAFSGLEPVRGVSARNYPQILWTPLFIKAPRQTQGVISDQVARSVDVLPTIADLLDVDLPWAVDGRSLLGQPRADGDLSVLDYHQNTLSPQPGREHLSVDGVEGFAETLRARASSAGGDPALRLYRLGPYGDLIGTPAAPFVQGSEHDLTGSVKQSEKFDDVDLSARKVPWAWISGRVDGANPGELFAITVNGVISGMSELADDSDGATFWSSLPPQFFRPGHNEIGVYRIQGSPDVPRLEPVRLVH